MTFYLLDDPMRPSMYARFSHVGTWSACNDACKECGLNSQDLIEPLQIEWDTGTDRIGHFSWCCYTSIVTEEVGRRVLELGFEVHFEAVEVLRPTDKSKHRRVPFPYVGPKLLWLVPDKQIPLNEVASKMRLDIDCPVCGRQKFKFKTRNLVINRSDWSGEKIFKVSQLKKSGAMFVTEEGLRLLKKEGFANLCPRKAGVIV